MDNIDTLKELAGLTALNDMLAKGWLSISTLDQVARMMGRGKLGGPAYDVLHALHCVNFDKMPPELRDSIPDLIRECLGSTVMFRFDSLQPRIVNVPAAPKRPVLLRLLGR